MCSGSAPTDATASTIVIAPERRAIRDRFQVVDDPGRRFGVDHADDVEPLRSESASETSWGDAARLKGTVRL